MGSVCTKYRSVKFQVCKSCSRFRKIRVRPEPKRIVLLLAGLDNAGKTVAVKNLAGENRNDVMPTVGFSAVNLKRDGNNIIIYDLGGGEQIRGIWKRYFVDVHGIIFVVDASDATRLDECESVLHEMIADEQLQGKPLLILANKQDCDGALDELDVTEHLQIEKIANRFESPTLIETCSAISSADFDKNIRNGYIWLVSFIINNFDILDTRVQKDIRRQTELDDLMKQQKHNGLIQRQLNEKIQMENRYGPQLNHLKDMSRPATCPTRSSKSSDVLVRPKSALNHVRDELVKASDSGMQKYRPKFKRQASAYSRAGVI